MNELLRWISQLQQQHMLSSCYPPAAACFPTIAWELQQPMIAQLADIIYIAWDSSACQGLLGAADHAAAVHLFAGVDAGTT